MKMDTDEKPKEVGGGAATTPSSGSASTSSASSMIDEVVMHPLVLLSTADHYHRVARGTRKRVVGVLLGQVFKGKVDVTNSFALPFEEDSRNPAIFYLDHIFLEKMLLMFKKVNAKERVVGFYSTGPQIRPNDLRIYDIVERFTGNSTTPIVFCIIDVRPDRPDLPVTSYKVTEEVSTYANSKNGDNGGKDRQVQRTFSHVSSSLGAMEAEEVGVEHLLRDINDPTVSTVASLIKGKLSGLTTLGEKLIECQEYLESCARGNIKVNSEIIANLQTIVSLLPNFANTQLVRSMMLKTNDMYMSIYVASLIRSIIALHDLVNNKIRYGEDGTEYREDEMDNDNKNNENNTSSSGEEKKDEKGDDIVGTKPDSTNGTKK